MTCTTRRLRLRSRNTGAGCNMHPTLAVAMISASVSYVSIFASRIFIESSFWTTL